MTLPSLSTSHEKRKLQEDKNDILEAYANQYGSGTYVFGEAGGDSGCSLSWHHEWENGKQHIIWRYVCGEDPSFENDERQGNAVMSRFRQQSCLGRETDFENFTCLFSINSYDSTMDLQQEVSTLLQFTLECKNDEGCTCNTADVSLPSCDVCSTCPMFTPSDIADFMKQEERIMPNMELACFVDSLDNSDLHFTQSCPLPAENSPPPSRDAPQMWSLTAIIAVFVVAVLALIVGIALLLKSSQKKKRRNMSPVPKGLINIFTYEDVDELETINLSPKSEEE